MSSEWTVNGQRARSQSEYEAFLRDARKIEAIKKKIDINDYKQLEKLYSSLCVGTVKFESKLGFDFEDEISEIYNDRTNKIPSNRRSSIKVKEEKFEKVEETEDSVDKDLVKYYMEKQAKQKALLKYIIVIGCVFLIITSLFFVVSRIISDSDKEAEMEEIKHAMADDAFIFTTIKPTYNTSITYDTYEIPDILYKFKDLHDQNNDLIGWIKIEDTNIDYPVMAGKDNAYYLSHSFNGKQNANGCIFMDMNCSIFPRSKNVILYGHHMKSGKMFANLEKYDSYDFYTSHKTFIFDSIYEEAEYEVAFVFRDYVHASDDTGFKYYEFVNVDSEAEFESYINELKNKSMYDTNVEVGFDDELLTLSTCDYAQENGRFVVMAKKIKHPEGTNE